MRNLVGNVGIEEEGEKGWRTREREKSTRRRRRRKGRKSIGEKKE